MPKEFIVVQISELSKFLLGLIENQRGFSLNVYFRHYMNQTMNFLNNYILESFSSCKWLCINQNQYWAIANS